jgi:hypothetical protein
MWDLEQNSCHTSPLIIILSGVRPSPLVNDTTTGLLYQPLMIDGDCGAVGGMKIGRGNRCTRRKSDPLCLLQILHDQTRARTRAAALGSLQISKLSQCISILVGSSLFSVLATL